MDFGFDYEGVECWALWRCNSGTQQRLLKIAQRWGIEAWSPYAKRLLRLPRKQRKVIVDHALLPGMIFVSEAGPNSGLFHTASRTIGVEVRRETFGRERPVRIERKQMAGLFDAVKGVPIKDEPDSAPLFRVGDRVEITQGPFQGVRGVVTKISCDTVSVKAEERGWNLSALRISAFLLNHSEA